MLRVIPTMLLDGHRLVKTMRFKDPVYVGDPRNVMRIFNEKEADELLLLDIGASKRKHAPDYTLLGEIISEAFMPVCYGGGVRSVEDARRLLRLGVEKVAINTAALDDPSLINRLSREFGAQCVVASIDVRRSRLGGMRVHSHAGKKVPESDPVRWAQRLVEQGAGEVLLQSVDREGTMKGLDIGLLQRFNGAITKPLIAGGGAGTLEHMRAACSACDLSGLSVGARFVMYGPHRAVLVSYLDRDEIKSLQNVRRPSAGAH